MKIRHNVFVPIALSALLTLAQPLHAQTCRNDITPTTPTQDFTIHNDGTVTHRKTGLMWMRCELGQSLNGAGCTGGKGYTWAGAMQAADSSNFAGYSDWRLPNIKELASIVEQACFAPAINTVVFPVTLTILDSFPPVWSSSPYAGDVKFAWAKAFLDVDDKIYDKTYGGHVRLVRGGQ